MLRPVEVVGGKPPRGLDVRQPQLGESPVARLVVTTRAQVPSPPPGVPWIWLCSTPIPRAAATEATLRGAYDCMRANERERLSQRLDELAALSQEQAPETAPGLVAQSAAGKHLLERLSQAARTSQPVLLTGETGTGKEVAAQLIHARSPAPAAGSCRSTAPRSPTT